MPMELDGSISRTLSSKNVSVRFFDSFYVFCKVSAVLSEKKETIICDKPLVTHNSVNWEEILRPELIKG